MFPNLPTNQTKSKITRLPSFPNRSFLRLSPPRSSFQDGIHPRRERFSFSKFGVTVSQPRRDKFKEEGRGGRRVFNERQ